MPEHPTRPGRQGVRLRFKAGLAYVDRIPESLENLEALATAGILIVAVLIVIWFL